MSFSSGDSSIVGLSAIAAELDNYPEMVKDFFPISSNIRGCQNPNMTRESTGAKLKRLREAAGLTKAELRRQSGVSYDTINKLETGKQESTSPENLVALAEVLGAELLPDRLKDGFSEPNGSFESSASRTLKSLEPAQEHLGDTETEGSAGHPSALHVNEIKIATVGKLAQIVATVDKDGLAKLRKKLDAIETMLDD